MTWGISTALFTQIHVALSLVGIVTGLIALYGMLKGRLLRGWTAIFLASTILTSLTGFPLPPFGLDPPRVVGVLSVLLLAVAAFALYGRHLAGIWRVAYVVVAIAALYLNAFVGVVQSFQKVSPLQRLAPTQTEPPFLIAQLVVLATFVVLGVLATRRLEPASATMHV